jgi:SAM-dependent methyltransferase
VDDSDVICGHRTVSDTLGHDLVTSNQDHRYLVNKSSRVVPPIQRGLHVSNLPGAWNQPERRHQSGAGQRLQRGLLVWVEIDHTTGGTEEHGDDTVATGAPPGDAAVAIHVQYAHAHSFRSRPAAITISQGTDTFLVPESSREIYSHGHNDSVLRSHRWRTAENSAAYLLPRLNNADRLLDVGIGPGTITLDLAERLSEGWVVGVDSAPAAVAATRALARAQGVNNLRLMVGDAYQLAFADASFDVVHAHQLVQHLAQSGNGPSGDAAGLPAGRSGGHTRCRLFGYDMAPAECGAHPMARAVPARGPLKRRRTRRGPPAACLGACRWFQ